MLFSDHPRTHYRNAPAHEVICQLRFPSILTINTVEPADFQEAIRSVHRLSGKPGSSGFAARASGSAGSRLSL